MTSEMYFALVITSSPSIIDEKIKEAKGLELTETSLVAFWLEDVSIGKFQLVFTSRWIRHFSCC